MGRKSLAVSVKKKLRPLQLALGGADPAADRVSQGGCLRTAGLFAGIGGIEAGLEQAGHQTRLLVENAPPATAVLRVRFPKAQLLGDIHGVKKLPRDVDLVTAGFPCQDLSSVGQKMGIEGTKSRLVGEVFRLLETRKVPWVILENVPFILQLDRGGALRLVTSALEDLGYVWAYRVIDAECFGVPQRRRRWFLVASRGADPRPIVLIDQAKPHEPPPEDEVACGFYWTEGMRALGWAVDAVPPIKVGSALGVASPPAILFSDGSVATPDIRDAERLQGFSADWTLPAEKVARPGFRWQLVGNAVCVPVSAWLGQRFLNPGTYDGSFDSPVSKREPWPYAAWSLERGKVFKSEANDWPVWLPRPHLQEFLQYPVKPLSPRAAAGFLKRAGKGTLRLPDRLIKSLKMLAERLDSEPQAGAASSPN